MFLRRDVEALSALALGDFKAHLGQKQAERNERKRKREEAKMRHQARWDKMVTSAAQIRPMDDFAAWISGSAPDLPHTPVDDADEFRMLTDRGASGLDVHGLESDPYMGMNDVSSAFDSLF